VVLLGVSLHAVQRLVHVSDLLARLGKVRTDRVGPGHDQVIIQPIEQRSNSRTSVFFLRGPGWAPPQGAAVYQPPNTAATVNFSSASRYRSDGRRSNHFLACHSQGLWPWPPSRRLGVGSLRLQKHNVTHGAMNHLPPVETVRHRRASVVRLGLSARAALTTYEMW